MVIADNISKSFDKKLVLDDISFAIEEGKTTALIGLNGCGKTTLLKIIAGILEADGGYIRVDGKEPAYYKRGNFVGYLDNKETNMGEYQTVEVLLELYKRMYRVPEEHYNYVKYYAGEQLGIQEFLPKNVNELSKGERAKINFLQMLLMQPVLWILDEPTIGMDYESRIKMYELLRNFKEKVNATVLIVTHNMQEMEWLCDKAVVLHEGHIIFSGKLEWLQEKYKPLGIISFEITSGAVYVQDMPLKKYWVDGSKMKILYDKRYVSAVVILRQLFETAKLKNIRITDMDIETMIKQVLY